MARLNVKTLIVDDAVPGANAVVGMAMSREEVVYASLTNLSGNRHLLLKYDTKTGVAEDCGVILLLNVSDEPLLRL